MKKVLLLLTGLVAAVFLKAQWRAPKTGLPYFRDSSIIQRFRGRSLLDSADLFFQKEFRGFDPMPVAGALRKGMDYIGNNGNGFEVYRTLHDNMYILKPDSTFSSRMPVRLIDTDKQKKE